jgi:hypothetical protein
VTALGSVRPAGYAAAAAEFLDEAAADGDGQDVAVRQLAALQGIGWALLAIGDQLADGTDAAADCAAQLSGVAGALDDLHQPAAGRLCGLLGRFVPGSPGGRP